MFLQEYEMTIDRYSYWIYFHYSFGAQGWDIRYSGLKKIPLIGTKNYSKARTSIYA